MKNNYSNKFILAILFIAIISIQGFGFHSTATPECGQECGKGNIHVWLYTSIGQEWKTNNSNVPSLLRWQGEYYYIIKDHATGTIIKQVGGSFDLDNISVTTYSDGSKQSKILKVDFMPLADLLFDLPVDEGVYDIYEYASYTLTGTGFSESHTFGSLTIPQTESDLVPYPLHVDEQYIQYPNLPSEVSIDGFKASEYSPIPIYTCKSAWSFRLDFDHISDCRDFEVKIDWEDVTAQGCNGSGNPNYGTFTTFPHVFDPDKNLQHYVITPDLNALLNSRPLTNSLLVGHLLKLTITIRGVNNAVCPTEIITTCVQISSSPSLSVGLKLIKANGAGKAAPYHSTPVSASTLCGYHTAAFSVDYTGAITQFKISLQCVDNYGSTITTLVNNYTYNVPTSGGIPDFNLNLINIPANGTVGWSGGTGYFSWAGSAGTYRYYKVTVQVLNECGVSSPEWSYFRLDPSVLYLKQIENSTTKIASNMEFVAPDSPELPHTDIHSQGLVDFFAKAEDQITFYPNPATFTLYISGLTDITELSIIDLSGKMIQNFNNTDNITFLDISKWTPQLYFWCAVDKYGQVQIGKFVKQ